MRPRLLVLSQTLPWPEDSGVKSRTGNVLRQLARAFDLHALCFYREATVSREGPEAAVRALGGLGTIEAFPIPQERSALRRVRDHTESLLARRVYTVPAYRSASFTRRLEAVLTGWRPALVHADSLDLSGYFDRVPVPLACTHHDVQSTLLARRAARSGSRLGRRYLGLQARLMAAEERRWCPRVALNVVVSTVDRDALEAAAPGASWLVVPNGVDLPRWTPGEDQGSGVLFLGASGWFPNLDGMRWFIAEVLPHLRQVRPGVTVTWVGAVDAAVRRGLTGPAGVATPGHVPDLLPWLREAGCVIAPLRIGSGTRVKVLDAWAMRKAVVSTGVGCEGLEARDGENLLVRDDPRAFAEAVARVLEDGELRQRLGGRGRATVEEHHDWNALGRRMTRAYLDLIGRPPGGAA